MIKAILFHDLLDCLAGQFFSSETKNARCTGTEFGLKISLAAQDFFSIAIIPKELPKDRVVLGVLSDDSAKIASRNGYTFTIYIDVNKIKGDAFNILSSIILAHEICHFAYYYELFLRLGGTTATRVQNNFTWQIADKLINAVIEEQDSTSQTNIDEHSIIEMVETFENYDKKHFTKGDSILTDYSVLFLDFLDRLNFDKMLNEYKNKR
ncbi:MAG: hypothetical protein FWD22_06460 [Treponema sp.]|nr:hypothetical protein [Treponema sp.]